MSFNSDIIDSISSLVSADIVCKWTPLVNTDSNLAFWFLYLLINLLGKNDDWRNTESKHRTFLEWEEIVELLKDFEIDEYTIKEREFDSETTMSKTPKHWHTFFICAKKK